MMIGKILNHMRLNNLKEEKTESEKKQEELEPIIETKQEERFYC